MSGVAIIRELMANSPAITAVTPRVIAGVIPQATVLPEQSL